MSVRDRLEHLRLTRAESCTRCGLHRLRNRVVFGTGDPEAPLVLVGEGPGADEDRLGEPFVGPSGKMLDGMLRRLDLVRGDGLYICNVVKCRPPGNRDPEPEEVRACSPFLHLQLRIIRPRVIVALGRVAGMFLTGEVAGDTTVGYLRNHEWVYENEVSDFRCPVVVTYHPSYVLRNLGDDKTRAKEATLKMLADFNKAHRIAHPSP